MKGNSMTYRDELAHVVTPEADRENGGHADERSRHAAVETSKLNRMSQKNKEPLARRSTRIQSKWWYAQRTPSLATSLRAQSTMPVYIGGWPGAGFSIVWMLTLIRSSGWPVATRQTPEASHTMRTTRAHVQSVMSTNRSRRVHALHVVNMKGEPYRRIRR